MKTKDLNSLLVFGLLVVLVFAYSIYVFFKYIRTHEERLIETNLIGEISEVEQ